MSDVFERPKLLYAIYLENEEVWLNLILGRFQSLFYDWVKPSSLLDSEVFFSYWKIWEPKNQPIGLERVENFQYINLGSSSSAIVGISLVKTQADLSSAIACARNQALSVKGSLLILREISDPWIAYSIPISSSQTTESVPRHYFFRNKVKWDHISISTIKPI